MSADEIRRVLTQINEKLAPPGWSVRVVNEAEAAFTIEINHELSTPHCLSFFRGSQHDQFLNQTFELQEFEIVASAPREPDGRRLLSSTRQFAQANGWTGDVVASIARLLYANELLTAEEATWLEGAGAPWSEL